MATTQNIRRSDRPKSRTRIRRPTIEFIKAALRNPIEVSTLFPTSAFLARALLDKANLDTARSIVELGPGTGAITQHLAPRIHKRASYFGIEIVPEMTEFLRKEFPDLRFETGAAQNVREWIRTQSVDTAVSSLPWSIFSEEARQLTIAAIHESLKPGGVFLTYMCANVRWYPSSREFLKNLNELFTTVEKGVLEWRNIPPAFVYRAIK